MDRIEKLAFGLRKSNFRNPKKSFSLDGEQHALAGGRLAFELKTG
jgi:hypothetical protein